MNQLNDYELLIWMAQNNVMFEWKFDNIVIRSGEYYTIIGPSTGIGDVWTEFIKPTILALRNAKLKPKETK